MQRGVCRGIQVLLASRQLVIDAWLRGRAGVRRMPKGLAAACLVAAATGAQALDASLDQFVIYRNGVLYANDTFGDGVPPPSGQGTVQLSVRDGHGRSVG